MTFKYNLLAKKYNGVEVFQEIVKPKRTPKEKGHVRDSVLELIDDSLQYFAEPTYRVVGKSGKKKGEKVIPNLCYEEIDNDDKNVRVILRYRRKVITDDTNNIGVVTSKIVLPDILNEIRKSVADGALDHKLTDMKKELDDALKLGREKGKAKSTALAAGGK